MKLHDPLKLVKVLMIVLAVSICVVIPFVWAINTYWRTAPIFWNSNCQARRDGRLLLVFSTLSEDWRHYLIDLHGCRTPLSEERFTDDPAWSPAGDHVAFLKQVKENDRWFIFDVDIATMTTQKYQLFEGGRAWSLTWSADGARLLFRWDRSVSEPSELWQLDLATQQLNLLSQLLPVGANKISWSPDRSHVVFDASDDGFCGGRLYLQNIAGTSQKVIYQGECVLDYKWSFDGKTIAFGTLSESSEPPAQLCWMFVESGEIVCSQRYIGDFAWSPDGKQIAFATESRIDIIDKRTKRVTTLVDVEQLRLFGTAFSAYDLDWSPDGKYLAYVACMGSYEAAQTCNVHIVSMADKKDWRLTSIWGADNQPVWSPAIPASD